ncbi:MAG TPA: zinc-dependent peptidase [Chryseosolibacter sp.]
MITLFIVSGVIIVIVFFYREELGQSYSYAGRQAAPVRTLVLPVPQRYREILQKYFPYYQALSVENKTKFEKKVVRFIYGKQFIPRQVDEVTVEAKVLIAASAVQLTFGLPNVYLNFFRRILVYPNDYYSSITKRFHKGEVNPRFGIIVLSWQSFVDGYIQPNDSKNLGLHEMAHALRFENLIRSEDYPPFEAELLQQFDDYAHRVCNDPEFATQTFFRPYACTDEHEFFSVAVENFFERSEVFKAEMPELYSILVKLLGQDPTSLSVSA